MTIVSTHSDIPAGMPGDPPGGASNSGADKLSSDAAAGARDDVQASPNGASAQASDAVASTDTELIDVMFPLIDDDEWPPYPAEVVDAVLIGPGLAEVVGVPWFATNLSRGDIVSVSFDGIGHVGGQIVSRGGHSTLHVLAAQQAELAPIVAGLTALGAVVRGGLQPPMLAVDVPPPGDFDAVVAVLSAAESVSCGYTVACRQHRSRAARG